MGKTAPRALQSIGDLTPDDRNANKGTERGRKALARSLKAYGAGRSILADRRGRVIAGNKALEGARELGFAVRVVETDGKELVVVQRTDLDLKRDKAARELAIADNRVQELDLEWDAEVLKAFADEGLDLGAFFEKDELADLLGDPAPGAGSIESASAATVDRAAEYREKWRTERGQLWSIGPHRIVCADARDASTYTRLCDGHTPVLLVTSPPYASQRSYEIGDIDWGALVPPAIVAASRALSADGSALVNLGLVHQEGRVVEYWRPLIDAMGTERPLFGWYVWDQTHGLPGDWVGRLAPSHEFIFHFAKKARHPNKIVECKHAGEDHGPGGLRNPDGTINPWSHVDEPVQSHKIPDSVVRICRVKGGVDGHPAPFPPAFAQFLIEAYSNTSEPILDCFLGSGSSIVAAHECGRVGLGIEIEPKYVAVALERLSLLGLTPTLEARS